MSPKHVTGRIEKLSTAFMGSSQKTEIKAR